MNISHISNCFANHTRYSQASFTASFTPLTAPFAPLIYGHARTAARMRATSTSGADGDGQLAHPPLHVNCLSSVVGAALGCRAQPGCASCGRAQPPQRHALSPLPRRPFPRSTRHHSIRHPTGQGHRAVRTLLTTVYNHLIYNHLK